MSERIRNVCVAYTKGTKAAKKYGKHIDRANCPYGETKIELKHWWHGGYYDQLNNNTDTTLLINSDEPSDE